MSPSRESIAEIVAQTATAINSENYAEALLCCEAFAKMSPQHPQLYFFRGVIASSTGDFDTAIVHIEKAVQLVSPTYWAEPHLYLGKIYRNLGRQREAIEHFAKVIHHDSDNADIWYTLACCYFECGMLQVGYPFLQEALARDPENIEYQNTLLFHLPAMPGFTDSQRVQLFRQWAHHYADPLTSTNTQFDNPREPSRKLRIGYVSGDFRHHAAAFNLKPLFEYHNRKEFEIYAYSVSKHADMLTKDYQTLADVWHDVDDLSAVELANLIRSDKIDILVDCSGHTAGNRLRSFAYKPAPVQISAFGFIFTTGMKAIDYQISDEIATPPEREHLFIERLLHLPTQLCWEYLGDPDELPVNELPYVKNGYVTFGSANGSFKHNEYVVKLWAAILKQVPRSKLHLKHFNFGDIGVQEMFVKSFQREGIPSDRILFTGKTSSYEHMAFQQNIDVALDPFPYTGGMTTCETLYMGVPVIALDGDGIRTSQSILTLAGVPELVAKTPEEYVFKAVTLARNPQRMRDYRQSLRERMTKSPIMNGAAFSASVEAAYRIIWEKWCQQS